MRMPLYFVLTYKQIRFSFLFSKVVLLPSISTLYSKSAADRTIPMQRPILIFKLLLIYFLFVPNACVFQYLNLLLFYFCSCCFDI